MDKCNYCLKELDQKLIANPNQRKKFFVKTREAIHGAICNICLNGMYKSYLPVLGSRFVKAKRDITTLISKGRKNVSDSDVFNSEVILYESLGEIERAEIEITSLLAKIRKIHEEAETLKSLHFELKSFITNSVNGRYENRRKSANKAISECLLRLCVFSRDNYRCKHCNSEYNLSVDHIKPVIEGGRDYFGNLQTLCRSCNSKKGGK